MKKNSFFKVTVWLSNAPLRQKKNENSQEIVLLKLAVCKKEEDNLLDVDG
jgi:hypothetical protein